MGVLPHTQQIQVHAPDLLYIFAFITGINRRLLRQARGEGTEVSKFYFFFNSSLFGHILIHYFLIRHKIFLLTKLRSYFFFS